MNSNSTFHSPRSCAPRSFLLFCLFNCWHSSIQLAIVFLAWLTKFLMAPTLDPSRPRAFPELSYQIAAAIAAWVCLVFLFCYLDECHKLWHEANHNYERDLEEEMREEKWKLRRKINGT